MDECVMLVHFPAKRKTSFAAIRHTKFILKILGFHESAIVFEKEREYTVCIPETFQLYPVVWNSRVNVTPVSQSNISKHYLS